MFSEVCIGHIFSGGVNKKLDTFVLKNNKNLK